MCQPKYSTDHTKTNFCQVMHRITITTGGTGWIVCSKSFVAVDFLLYL